MIVQAKVQLYIPCPNCTGGTQRRDQIAQIAQGRSVTWTCSSCRSEFNITRVNELDFRIAQSSRINAV